MQQYSSRNVGIVSLVPMNGWNANIVYEKLNIVTHKNSTFIAKQKNRGIEPFVSSNWEDIWMPLISGVGIATAVVEYASTKITSPAPPESGWAEEMPELKPAEYVWTRVTITYTDGRKTIFYSVGAGGVPAKTSDLENDGEGTSPFATEKQLQAEKERAEAAEGANKTAIETETSRAKAAEQANAEAIQSESARAKAAESAEKTRAEGAEASLGNRITTIENKIPEQASASNKLADQAFVNSSINALAAFFITPTATGDKAFTTRAALLAATTFYNGGKPRVPTQNDYAIVLADESQPKGVDGTYPTTRYSYQGGTYPNGQWDFQYIVNNTSLTQAQVDAINSGITKELVAQITTNKNDIAAIKTKNSEQDASIASLTTRIGNVESKNSSQDEEIAAVKTAVSNAQERADDAYTLANGKYSKPSGGIPADDLAGGIPASKITGLPTIPSSLPPSGAAGGDLTGTYPNPSLSETLKKLINGAMPKEGGKFTGRVSWQESSLPAQTTSPYFVTIEAFASGGKTYYTSQENVKSNLGITELETKVKGLSRVATSGDYNDLTNKPSAYSLPTATASVLGGVKSSTTGTTANRDYNVQVNSDGTMKVNVPWTDNNTTYNIANATTAGLVKPISVITKPTINAASTTTGKYYAVQMSSDGAMFVNVPWVNTTYDLSGYAKTDALKSYLPIAGGTMTGRLVINKAGTAQTDSNAGHISFQRSGTEYGHIRLTASDSNLAIESKGGIILYGGRDFNGTAFQGANYIAILSGSVAASGTMDLTGFRNFGLSGTISHGSATLTLPTETGTIALTKQIPSLTNYYTKSETTQQINSAISSAITTVLNTPV